MNSRSNVVFDIDVHQRITDWVVEHISEFNNEQLDRLSFVAQSELIDRDQKE